MFSLLPCKLQQILITPVHCPERCAAADHGFALRHALRRPLKRRLADGFKGSFGDDLRRQRTCRGKIQIVFRQHAGIERNALPLQPAV